MIFLALNTSLFYFLYNNKVWHLYLNTIIITISADSVICLCVKQRESIENEKYYYQTVIKKRVEKWEKYQKYQ